MLNSIGPLGLIGLLLLVFALFFGGFLFGHSIKRKDEPGSKTPCFGLTEILVIALDLLFMGAGIFFVSIGDAAGAAIFGLGAALSTGILWGLSNCEFGHVRMF